MRTINDVLDRAKTVQKVKSDYKLSLTVGVSESSLSTYRKGISLPDEINCKKLADAAGVDPALLVVEMQAQRAKSDEARAIWLDIAKRLQAGFANCKMLAVLAILSIAVHALPAWATLYVASLSAQKFVYYVKCLYLRIVSKLTYIGAANVNLCKGGQNVSRHTHPTPFRLA